MHAVLLVRGFQKNIHLDNSKYFMNSTSKVPNLVDPLASHLAG